MVRWDDAAASLEPDTGSRFTPEMLEMPKLAPELRGKGAVKF